jgi:RNA methyltransferase, TrmH family
MVFITKDQDSSLPHPIYVSFEVMEKMCGMTRQEGICAFFPLPEPSSLIQGEKIIVLDQIRDPGNLGTLIRSAHGMGWDQVILTPNSVDLFNEKAIRAAKGASFFLPYIWMSHEKIIHVIKEKKYQAFLADSKGEIISENHTKKPLVLVMGSEKGVAPIFAKSLNKVSLFMTKNVESYNVAVAGSILMYLMRDNHAL